MKRVALNGRFSGVARPTGAQTVAFDLYDHVVRAERPFNLVIFADTSAPGVASWADCPGVELVHIPFLSWGRMRSQLFEQFQLSPLALKHGAGLLHHPINTCPRFAPQRTRNLVQVVTLLDLNFHHHPEWYGRAFRSWLELTTIPGLRKADRVICISDYVAEDARKTLGLDRGRVQRIYIGLRELGPGKTNVATESDTVLAVNPFQPHKNLARIIDAVGRLRAHRPEIRLRVVGRPQDNFRSNPELTAALEREYVTVTGYLSDEELAAEYERAAILCMPSFEEGFGMPIIEAMARNLTVVTSTTSCMPEVAGKAGILVDPSTTEAIAIGLLEALTEPGPERERRHETGRRHACGFSGNAVARQYIETFHDLLGAGS